MKMAEVMVVTVLLMIPQPRARLVGWEKGHYRTTGSTCKWNKMNIFIQQLSQLSLFSLHAWNILELGRLLWSSNMFQPVLVTMSYLAQFLKLSKVRCSEDPQLQMHWVLHHPALQHWPKGRTPGMPAVGSAVKPSAFFPEAATPYWPRGPKDHSVAGCNSPTRFWQPQNETKKIKESRNIDKIMIKSDKIVEIFWNCLFSQRSKGKGAQNTCIVIVIQPFLIIYALLLSSTISQLPRVLSKCNFPIKAVTFCRFCNSKGPCNCCGQVVCWCQRLRWVINQLFAFDSTFVLTRCLEMPSIGKHTERRSKAHPKQQRIEMPSVLM